MNRVRILAPVFFNRFFDNEIAPGAASLKTPFFWLVAFLAAPGIFFPIAMSFTWTLERQMHGAAGVDAIVRADKALYLGYGASAVGLVMTSVWSALMLERRDGLVLGGLPLRGREVVGAKALALAAYIGLLISAVHIGAALVFGLFLTDSRGQGSIVANAAAHFVTSALYGAFVCFSMMALQGLTLAAAGGRAFTRLSSLLQLLATAVALAGLFAIPTITNATVDTIAGTGRHNAPWILSTPTLWFLGVQEVLLGFRTPILVTLATRALTALAIVAAVAVVTLPLSYARLMTASIEQDAKRRRERVRTRLSRMAVRICTWHPQTRAVADFFLIAIARHSRPRLAVAAAAGATIAWAGPTLVVTFAHGNPSTPTPALLGLPLAAMGFLVAGFRTAASLPSELPPRWLFAVEPAAPSRVKNAAAGVAFALAVVVPTALSAAAGSRWWPASALPHAVLCLAVGWLLVECAFAQLAAPPCTTAFRPEGANLRAWWPAYLAGFSLIVYGLPLAELALAADRVGSWVLACAPIPAAVAARVMLRRRAPSTVDDEDLPHVQVLDI